MGETSNRRPLFVLLMAVASGAMFIPSVHALAIRDFSTARAFFYSFLLFSVLTLLIALATRGRRSAYGDRGPLIGLFAGFLVLPLMLAVPLWEAVPQASLLDGWFEMVSDLTTTGATLYENPRDLPRSVHLWRALVGWMGGLLIWVAALAILAPLRLGGFEVFSAIQNAPDKARFIHTGRSISTDQRLIKYARKLVPLYGGLTALLWFALTLAGEIPFVALCHAMSVMATSGISPVGGVYYSGAGIPGEILIALFLLLSLSHLTFARAPGEENRAAVLADPELRLGLTLVTVLAAALFLRHLLIVPGETGVDGPLTALRAAWGGFFTVLSFLTTTGFESADWSVTQRWSGLETPGLILVGLAVIGGGVATTAGGVKLLRVYALFKHSEREVERMVHPSSVGGAGAQARRVRRQGAQIAWIVFMIFAVSIAAVMLLLALTGVQFETAMVLAVAALSTTGPLADIAGETPISYAGLPDLSKVVLGFAMVLGRLEALALIALLNPEFWRR